MRTRMHASLKIGGLTAGLSTSHKEQSQFICVMVSYFVFSVAVFTLYCCLVVNASVPECQKLKMYRVRPGYTVSSLPFKLKSSKSTCKIRCGFIVQQLHKKFTANYKCGFTVHLFTIEQLLCDADNVLFRKVLIDGHCPHQLPPVKTLNIQLRPASHNCQLPICK